MMAGDARLFQYSNIPSFQYSTIAIVFLKNREVIYRPPLSNSIN